MVADQPEDRRSDDGNGATDDAVERRSFREDPIEHVTVDAGMSVGELGAELGRAGGSAVDLNAAIDIAATMFEDDVTTFFGLAGAMVPMGMRRIVAELIDDGYIDVLVTTGANLTHDAIEAIGGAHHHGAVSSEGMSEREHDERLRDEGVDRIYNVYLPQEHFTAFERHLRSDVFPALAEEADGERERPDGTTRSGPISIARVTQALGRANAEVNEAESIPADPGIAAAAARADVPIFCPAIQDSILGLQTWMYAQRSPLAVDAFADMSTLNDLAFEAEESGAFLVGGGVPKNFVLQTMLVTPGAYDYAVQLTMDPPQTGGLSGASLEEARSWGKLEREATNASVYGDATVTLPLVVAAARERLEEES